MIYVAGWALEKHPSPSPERSRPFSLETPCKQSYVRRVRFMQQPKNNLGYNFCYASYNLDS